MVNFSGPPVNKWYNDGVISWTIDDTSSDGRKPTRVAGFSVIWNTDPGDPSYEATPGTGNSFYTGPGYHQTSGCLALTYSPICLDAGELGERAWGTLNVRAWDNTGISENYTYGPVGRDTIPPQTTGQASTTNPVTITLTATDASSGVASTVYQLDGGATTTYTKPFPVSGVGSHKLTFHSTDNAGNVESTETLSFPVLPKTTTAVTSSVNPSQLFQTVTFTATVSASGGTPAGTVAFFNGSNQLGVATLSAGKAAFQATNLAVGAQSITASYTGSAKLASSTSPVLTQTVVKSATSTTLTSSPNPSTLFSSVTFTAKVTGAFGGSASGTVSFMNDSQVLGTGTVSALTNLATFVATPGSLAAGTWPIQAVYEGDSDFNTSTSPVLEQVVSF
ncbi:MAG: Ig-like domain-containing protein [Bryobacteraceae bacterium]